MGLDGCVGELGEQGVEDGQPETYVQISRMDELSWCGSIPRRRDRGLDERTERVAGRRAAESGEGAGDNEREERSIPDGTRKKYGR